MACREFTPPSSSSGACLEGIPISHGGLRLQGGGGPWKYNDFSVRFVNATTRVVVEAINYGFNARVAFGTAGPKDQFENCDLLDFVAIRCPGEGPNAEELTRGQLRNTGALAQLGAFAAILRRCGVGVLRGRPAALFRRSRKSSVDDVRSGPSPPSPRSRRGWWTRIRESGLAACFSLTRFGRGRECIPTLIEALDESDTDVRAIAALTLAAAGTAASEAIPALEARPATKTTRSAARRSRRP